MEIQLNDYHKKVNAQKMASMAYWREHPSLQSAGIVRHFQKHSSLFTFVLRTELNRKLALFGWGAENLFFMSHRFTQIYTDFPVSGSG